MLKDIYIGHDCLVELSDGGQAVGIISEIAKRGFHLVDKDTKVEKPFDNGRTLFTADEVERVVPNIARAKTYTKEEQALLDAMTEDVQASIANVGKKKPTGVGGNDGDVQEGLDGRDKPQEKPKKRNRGFER